VADQAYRDEIENQKSTSDAALAHTKDAYDELLEREKELTAEARKERDEARQRIVEQLAQNFKDVFDGTAVEIDEKTGRVKLNFHESYFVRGSFELSKDMKDFLRVVIPKYARSIYSNPDAAKHVQSLKISGMTSPVYRGRYVDVNDTSPATARARQFNLSLSDKRAVAMYDFIFDQHEMGDYEYRARMKADMSISADGYENAQPVPDELIGKLANCEEYDCRQEQATILQFSVFSEE
jgi:flagellar motor protein MotB